MICCLSLASAVLMGCSLCGNSVIADIPSPKGNRHVVVFERDCGATAGFSTQVSVLSPDRTLGNQAGNVFSADDNHGAVHLTSGNVLPIQLSWISNDELVIRYPAGARVFLSKARIGEITITCQPTRD